MDIKFEQIRESCLLAKYNNILQHVTDNDCRDAINILCANKEQLHLFTKTVTTSKDVTKEAGNSDGKLVAPISEVKKYVSTYVPTTVAFKSDTIAKLMYKKEWFRLQDIQKINRIREFISRKTYANNEFTIGELITRIKDLAVKSIF